MTHIDVFNGDADGICSLLQLRLDKPTKSMLVTGVKRDINLLKRVTAQAGDKVTVLDVSMDKNRSHLQALLAQNVSVFYVDHHFSGEIPDHPALEAHIDTHSNICTSLIINKHLAGRQQLWAITGAYGDNLFHSAEQVAMSLSLDKTQCEKLKKLGTYLNYNGYGTHLDDLYFPPDILYQKLIDYASPFDFIADPSSAYMTLENGYIQDIQAAQATPIEYENDDIAVYILPDSVGSRRVSGVFGNALANASPDKAHAVLTHNAENGFVVSIRAPLNNKTGADQICRQFPSGGGRAAAAGINHLDKNDFSRLIEVLNTFYASQS
jgi:hypothetical protein